MNNADNNIWIFLSHSNNDYEKVRQVRNMLEEQNLRPLMFFLQCLNDEDEIDDLIRREIDCRTRFILCDSEEARKSKWVQKEVEYIKSKDRMCEIVDLNKPMEVIEQTLLQFVKKTRIFVSYNREEVSLAKEFATRIDKYEFSVYMDMLWDESQVYHQDYTNETVKNLDSSTRDGVVVAFVNERIFTSPDDALGSCRYELLRAIELSERQGTDKPNIILFVKNDNMISRISEDPSLAPLSKAVIKSLDGIDKKCDSAIETVLYQLLPVGSIISQADKFANGVNCLKDEKEASWLYGITRKRGF